jgi:hypothetical protein
MSLVKFVGFVWLFLIGIFFVGFIIGYFIENKVADDKPLKKWWRRNMVGEDPGEEDFWKNFKG